MHVPQGFNTLHIIESLGQSENQPGQELINRLKPTLTDQMGIPLHYWDVHSIAELEEALGNIYQSEVAAECTPALHFECHGSADDGIKLRDGSFYAWPRLADQLLRFNRASEFHTLAVFSCCEGISQITSASSGRACPFAALVGCDDTITTPELLEGFDRFYLTLVKSKNGTAALAALQTAVIRSNARFGMPTAETIFMGTVQKVTAQSADPTLRALRVKRLREFIDKIFAKAGRRLNLTDRVLEKALLDQELVTLRHFYERFFDTARIPSNLKRYDFAKMLEFARTGSAPLA